MVALYRDVNMLYSHFRKEAWALVSAWWQWLNKQLLNFIKKELEMKKVVLLLLVAVMFSKVFAYNEQCVLSQVSTDNLVIKQLSDHHSHDALKNYVLINNYYVVDVVKNPGLMSLITTAMITGKTMSIYVDTDSQFTNASGRKWVTQIIMH